MMTREDFKRLAAGNFVMQRDTTDKNQMSVYVEGATFAFDYLKQCLDKKTQVIETKQKEQVTTSGQ